MKTNVRIVVVVLVAFVVGAGAGAFGEHEHLKSKTNKKASGVTATTSTVVPAVLFVGANAKSACPALKIWSASALAGYKALGAKSPWKTTSAALVKQFAAGEAAFRTLVPLGSPGAKTTLHFLVGYEIRMTNATKRAKSFAAYQAAAKVQNTPRTLRSLSVAGAAAKTC
jgi:hypothetical protein